MLLNPISQSLSSFTYIGRVVLTTTMDYRGICPAAQSHSKQPYPEKGELRENGIQKIEGFS